VLISYFSLAVIFGVLFNHLHDPWYIAPLMSLFVYAGAVQFISIGIMATFGSYWLIFFSTVFVACRNSFYGLSLLKRFNYKPLLKMYMIFTLVDANYAIMTSHLPYEDKEQDKLFCFYLAFFMQISWMLGTFFGALFSSHLKNVAGLEFILIAYFAILVFENYLKNKLIEPIIIGLVAAMVAFFAASLKMMLLVGILISFIAQTFIYVKEKRKCITLNTLSA
jgi:4-azaleucine resistance transporter AzlC